MHVYTHSVYMQYRLYAERMTRTKDKNMIYSTNKTTENTLAS